MLTLDIQALKVMDPPELQATIDRAISAMLGSPSDQVNPISAVLRP